MFVYVSNLKTNTTATDTVCRCGPCLSCAGGPPKAVARHKKRGRLTVRERVALLFDTECEPLCVVPVRCRSLLTRLVCCPLTSTKFLELSKLAGYNADPEPVAGGGLVTGIGKVNG